MCFCFFLPFSSWLEVRIRAWHGFSDIWLYPFTVGTWKGKENLAPKIILFLKLFSLTKNNEISCTVGFFKFNLFICMTTFDCRNSVFIMLSHQCWLSWNLCVVGRACIKGMISWPMWQSPLPLQRYSSLGFFSSCINMEILASFIFHRSPFYC